MIDESYIKTFIPIHELEQLKPPAARDIIQLSGDDLFLISKMVTKSTEDSNAKMASMKIAYGDLIDKISSDLDIHNQQYDIDELSGKVIENYNDLSNRLQQTSSFLSDEVVLSVDTINSSMQNLSDVISKTYISVQSMPESLNILEESTNNRLGQIANQIVFDTRTGQPSINGYTNISDLIVLDYERVATGAIQPSVHISQTCAITSDNEINAIIYGISTDCYLNCMLSVRENDASTTPIEVYVYGDSGQIVKIDHFNNPGGFSGVDFYNYYRSSISLKKTTSPSVVIKYEDGSAFKSGTKAQFDEYEFYAVASKDDLSNYVEKDSRTSAIANSLTAYRFMTNENGMVVSAEPLYVDQATPELLGMVKLCGETQIDNNFGLNLDNTNRAYVKMPFASQTNSGIIKTGSGISYDTSRISTDLLIDNNGKAYTEINVATTSNLGLTKLCGDVSCVHVDPIDTGVIQLSTYTHVNYGVQIDNDSRAFVKIPVASLGNFGVVKSETKDIALSNHNEKDAIIRNIYVDNDGYAKVDVRQDLDFSPESKSQLNNADKILVNYSDSNLENYIKYDDFKSQLLMTQDIPFNSASMPFTAIKVELNDESRVDPQQVVYSSPDGQLTGFCNKFGDYAWTSTNTGFDANGKFDVYVQYEGNTINNSQYAVQIIFNGLALTQFNPSIMKTKPSDNVTMNTNSKFFDLKHLGIFEFNSTTTKPFVVASGENSFSSNGISDSVTFFVKKL